MKAISAKKLTVLIVILILSQSLTGCALIDAVFGGLGRLCDRDPLVVTKTEDTEDGLCTAEDCSLREAVITANACEGRQQIEIPAGRYPLTIAGRDEDRARTGDLDITDTVSIRGVDGEVVIDGEGLDRVFHVLDPSPEPDVNSFSGITITGGSADFTGGGVLLDDGWLDLQDVVIRGNEAGGFGSLGGAGGGFYARDHLTVTNLRLENNTAHGSGGGGYVEGAYLLVNEGLVAAGNQSLGGEGGGGLFLFGDSTADIFDSQFVENQTAASGGGIWSEADLQLVRTSFEINEADLNGGGLYQRGSRRGELTETWFTNNSANQGGGFYNEGRLDVFQSGINTNTAFAGLGGGIFNQGSSAVLLIRSSTISANMVVPTDEGGGAGIINNGGELRLEFSTLAYNNTNGVFNRSGLVRLENTVLGHHGGDNCVGNPVDSGGYNLEDGTSCDFAESSDLEADSVGIDWLALNGGFSLNHALLPGSPALDSGDPGACPPADQRGVSRPQGDRCDRGSFESEELAGEGSDTAPATAVPTVTPTRSATPTPTISVTPELEKPAGTLDQNAFCRTGPGTVYPAATAYEAGTELVIEGQSEFEPRWWWVVVPSTGGHCWISDALLTVTGPAAGVPEIEAPPTPTPTKTPMPVTPSPTYQGQGN